MAKREPRHAVPPVSVRPVFYMNSIQAVNDLKDRLEQALREALAQEGIKQYERYE